MLQSTFFWKTFALFAAVTSVSASILAALLSSLNSPLTDVRFWLVTVFLYFCGGFVTSVWVRRLLEPLNSVNAAVQKLAAGETPGTILPAGRDEYGYAVRSFESHVRQLEGRLADVQLQRKRLQHNLQQLEIVLEAMVEGVIAVDEREHVLLANNAAFRLLETTPTAMVGRPVWEVVRQPGIDDLVRKALRGESPERLEFHVSRLQTVISVAVSRLPGTPCPGAVLVLHDVTDLRRLEQMRREFVANVSHELKTPLTSIGAYTETLLDGAMDDPTHNREFLERIAEQTDRLQVLIIDLLSLARMESDETAFEVTPLDVQELLAASVDAHRAVAEAKEITLTLNGLPERAYVLADADGLRTIIDNLLDNALNYTPRRGCVSVRWLTESDWMQIEVHDTGVGIAQEFQARIFERFFRVDKARSRELGGTGLGLSIVKHLCQVFGGTVSVQSQLGEGSTFTVRLKRHQEEFLK